MAGVLDSDGQGGGGGARGSIVKNGATGKERGGGEEEGSRACDPSRLNSVHNFFKILDKYPCVAWCPNFFL